MSGEERSVATASRARSGAATALVVAGLIMAWGSSLGWRFTNDFLLPVDPASGIDLGPGRVVAPIGLALSVIGLAARRQGGSWAFRMESFCLALLALLTEGIFALDAYLGRSGDVVELGFWVTLLASCAAAAATLGLTPPTPRQRTWADAHRRAIVLLCTGILLWWLALLGDLGTLVSPLTAGVVIVALGVSLWPARRIGNRVEPTTASLLLIGYAAAALGALLSGATGPELLELAPVVAIIMIVGPTVLETPAGPLSAQLAAGQATPAVASAWVLKAALLVVAATTLLVGCADLGFGIWPHLSFVDGTAYGDRIRVVPAVLIGLATGAAIVAALARTARAQGENAGRT